MLEVTRLLEAGSYLDFVTRWIPFRTWWRHMTTLSALLGNLPVICGPWQKPSNADVYVPHLLNNLLKIVELSVKLESMWHHLYGSDFRYISGYLHTALFRSVLFSLDYWLSLGLCAIFFYVASLAIGQSADCPSASEVTSTDMGKSAGPDVGFVTIQCNNATSLKFLYWNQIYDMCIDTTS